MPLRTKEASGVSTADAADAQDEPGQAKAPTGVPKQDSSPASSTPMPPQTPLEAK